MWVKSPFYGMIQFIDTGTEAMMARQGEIEELENELASSPYPDNDDVERLRELKAEQVLSKMKLSTM